MSESIVTISAQLWEKMRKKKYRENFVAAHLSVNIAAQIQSLREANNWTQKQLAQKAGMSQARISVMENPAYDKFTFSTLKRLAAAFDVALIARFEAFSNLVTWVAELSPEKLAVPNFDSDSLELSNSGPADIRKWSPIFSTSLPSAGETEAQSESGPASLTLRIQSAPGQTDAVNFMLLQSMLAKGAASPQLAFSTSF